MYLPAEYWKDSEKLLTLNMRMFSLKPPVSQFKKDI